MRSGEPAVSESPNSKSPAQEREAKPGDPAKQTAQVKLLRTPNKGIQPQVAVDDKGCPPDSDGDGVWDGIDECPNTPRGVAVDSKGCPIKKVLFEPNKKKLILEGVNFEFDSAKLTSDSYAVLEGQGHNAGTSRIAPEGAYAAHEMDGQTTPLMDQMRQTQAKMMERTHAAAEKMRTALSPTSSAAAPTPSSSTSVSATPSTGTTSATPAPSSTVDVSQPTTDSGYKIAPVNPKGQAPTIVGPSS